MSKSFRIFYYDASYDKYRTVCYCSSLAIVKKKLVSLRKNYKFKFFCFSSEPCNCKLQLYVFDYGDFFFKYPAIDFNKDNGKFYKAAAEYASFSDDYKNFCLHYPEDACSALIYYYRDFNLAIRFYLYLINSGIIEPSSMIELGGNL
ncbi:MAG: hypothetical protein K6C97_12580 [Treponema sp.]|nr:hypothetical protein [Treponema sp.]